MTRKRVLASLTSSAILIPATAWGQDPDRGPIADIVVTAQRRDQPLMEVPISMRALDGEELRSRQVRDMEGALDSIPNAAITRTRNTGTEWDVAIRGISNAAALNVDGSVAVYIDDVFVPDSSGFNFELYDLASLELLRGPQGTLYGRNAIGGALNIRTQLPEEDIGGKLTFVYGTDDEVRLGGAIDLPIADGRLRTRISGLYARHDARIMNNAPGAKGAGSLDAYGLRFRTIYAADDSTSFELAGDYAETDRLLGAGNFDTVDQLGVNLRFPTDSRLKNGGASFRIHHDVGGVVLIPLMAEALGTDGLTMLKAKFEELAARPPAISDNDSRKVVAIGTRGAMFKDDYAARHQARLVQSALADIADAMGDVDGYAALHSDEDQANPAIAARIAERLLASGRPEDALAALTRAEVGMGVGGHWPEWQRARIDALEGSGRIGDAQHERWQTFERNLNKEYLKASIKRLPDFDDIEAESKALAYASRFPDFHQALSFLVEWPAIDDAARMILARPAELNGNHYWLLGPAAEAMEQRHPLAATLLLRAMIDFSLEKARYKRYPHAARHLQTCSHLDGKIDAYGEHADHQTYMVGLKARHGRKIGFWNA